VTDRGHPLPAHVRTIEVQAARGPEASEGPWLQVRGRLVDRRPQGLPADVNIAHDGDRIHDVEVTMTVRYPDLVVTAIEGQMRTVPYRTLCPEALPPLQGLVGLSVSRGFTRAVNERLGRERGCTHVVALILAMAPVVRQGAGAAFGFGNAEVVEPSSGQPWFVNSCQAWREGGVLHQDWLARRQGQAR
jgi:hypothetical protein